MRMAGLAPNKRYVETEKRDYQTLLLVGLPPGEVCLATEKRFDGIK